jgi:hypothetical protein
MRVSMVPAPAAYEIATALYPDASNRPLRAPVISKPEITDLLRIRGCGDLDEVFTAIWGS